MEEKSFLREYSLTPVGSSFALARDVVESNYKLVFINIVFYYTFTLLLYFLGTVLPDDGEEEMLLAFVGGMSLIVFALILISLIISNLLYYSNLVKSSESMIELKERVKDISFKAFYMRYFFSALGYLMALLILGSFLFLLAQLGDSVSKLFYIPLLIFALLFIYTHPSILERVGRKTTFKNGFKSLFLIFNFTFLKTVFNLKYFIFIFVFEWFYSILSKISDLPVKLVSKDEESYAFIFTDFLFVSIFTVFVTIILVAMATVMAKELIENEDESKVL